jgi:hypothetical protein
LLITFLISIFNIFGLELMAEAGRQGNPPLKSLSRFDGRVKEDVNSR